MPNPLGFTGFQPGTQTVPSRRADFDLLRRTANLEHLVGIDDPGVFDLDTRVDTLEATVAALPRGIVGMTYYSGSSVDLAAATAMSNTPSPTLAIDGARRYRITHVVRAISTLPTSNVVNLQNSLQLSTNGGLAWGSLPGPAGSGDEWLRVIDIYTYMHMAWVINGAASDTSGPTHRFRVVTNNTSPSFGARFYYEKSSNYIAVEDMGAR